jgi:ribosomal protein S18 acetylase RimI-like enzyme
VRDIEQLQAFLREFAANGREVVRVGPFQAFFDGGDEMKYLNYAVPDDGATPSSADVDSLRAAFRERERLPRLEWVEEAAPAVVGALDAAGMQQELATPLMACARDALRSPDVDVEIAPASAADALDVRNLQLVAFGQPPVESISATPDRMLVGRVGGVIATAGSWSEVIGGVSEVVGIATAEPYRRRGLAGALTAAAAKAAFDEGAELCVLSPGDETAMRVYERAGFSRVATMLHWSDDPSSH